MIILTNILKLSKAFWYIDIDISSNFQNSNSIKSLQSRYVNPHNHISYKFPYTSYYFAGYIIKLYAKKKR